MDEIELEPRDVARLISLGRVAIGLGAVIAPRRFGRFWTGEPDTGTTSAIAMRGLGARDVALGLGTLFALEGDGPVRGWLEAQALADASDAASTLLAFRKLPRLRALALLATAGGACYVNVALAGSIDD
jgi:hypothetical protein